MKLKAKSKKEIVIEYVSLAAFTFTFLLSTSTVLGQFQITQSVIAGGGLTSTGGVFSLSGTSGQSTTSTSTSTEPTALALRAGFWTESFAPTAASVSVGGRICDLGGTGVRNVRVTLTDLTNGMVVVALSSSFGYYRFDGIPVGRFYMITVSAKQFDFKPDSRVLSLVDEALDQDFTAIRN